MAKFLNHTELNEAVFDLFENAEEQLTIVSPFIKLHPKLKQILDKKKDDPDFFIELLYGKNVEKVEKSMSENDLDYFKSFRNVEIRYNEHLHAKYYANENSSIVTSLNLYEYSINNNIESGVLFQSGLLSLDRKNDIEAFNYFGEIIDESEVVYSKGVKKEKVFFGLFTKDGGSEVLEDNTKEFYGKSKTQSKSAPKIKKGYCIRTGDQIPFNTKKPYSDKSFTSWNRYKDENYKEKYCHYSGEKSDGKTSMKRPILSKNWKKAMSK